MNSGVISIELRIYIPPSPKVHAVFLFLLLESCLDTLLPNLPHIMMTMMGQVLSDLAF